MIFKYFFFLFLLLCHLFILRCWVLALVEWYDFLVDICLRLRCVHVGYVLYDPNWNVESSTFFVTFFCFLPWKMVELFLCIQGAFSQKATTQCTIWFTVRNQFITSRTPLSGPNKNTSIVVISLWLRFRFLSLPNNFKNMSNM